MKLGIQLNPQVSIDKPPETLLPALVEQTRVLLRTHTEWPAIGNLRSQHRLDAEATAIINDLVALTDDDREEYA